MSLTEHEQRIADLDIAVDPNSDGYDHIRIHPKATTSLGRMLCHATRLPFVHEKYGGFASMEAYWQWVRSGMQHDSLRSKHGYSAFRAGLRYPTCQMTDFHLLIISGLYAQIHQHEKFKDLLILSDIPIIQYSSEYGETDFVRDRSHPWYFAALHQLRIELQRTHVSPVKQKLPFKGAQILQESLLASLPKDSMSLA